MTTHSFPSLLNLISLFLVILFSKTILKGHKLDLTHLYTCWIMRKRDHWQKLTQNAKGDQQGFQYQGGLKPSMLPWQLNCYTHIVVSTHSRIFLQSIGYF